jgi:phosphoribosylanthranilate isomerase
MRDAENILQVASLRPDYMGFIFYPKSPRFTRNDFRIPEEFPPFIKRVGVFVDEKNETIEQLAIQHKLTHLQLHGHESPAQCGELKAKGYVTIKVFSVSDDFDFKATHAYRDVTDYFLFDTKGKFYGGNAQTFDWQILQRYDQQVPFFLSGGITPENVSRMHALRDMNLHAIDVNSGVEQAPGVKDLDKLTLLNTNLLGSIIVRPHKQE